MTTARFTASLRVPRILVVDDTPDNLFLMNALFEDRYEVMQAASGREAVELAMSRNPPDIVLLDIMMPEMDGYEVLRRIRQHPPTAAIPVIFLTALAGQKDERLGMQLGAIDYLTKPVDPEQVIARVDAHMRATAQARRMEALSEKLARHLPPREWRALFHTDAKSGIHFEQKVLSVLHADACDFTAWAVRGHEGFGEDVERLAQQHGGTIDAFVDQSTVVFFTDPVRCVKMAMELQRCTADMPLRMGIHTGICDLSTFGSGSHVDCTLIGPETGSAAKVAAAASSGGIVLSSETLTALGDMVHVDDSGHLIALAWDQAVRPATAISAAQRPVMPAASRAAVQ